MTDNRLDIQFTPEQPIYVTDECHLVFRDPATMLGGVVTIRRDPKGSGLIVAFEDLDPGVKASGVTSDPVEADNLVAILDKTIAWLENLAAVTLPGAWENAMPFGFDGLAALQAARDQLATEGAEEE